MRSPTVRLLLLLAIGSGTTSARASTVELHGGPRVFRIDPATLRVETVSSPGKTLHLIDAVDGLGSPTDLATAEASARWRLPQKGLTVEAGLVDEQLTIRVTADQPGELEWPVIHPASQVRALILPRGEGSYVPVDDDGWAADMEGYESSVTEEFSLPCFGLDLGRDDRTGQTVTFIIPIPFNTDITYHRQAGRFGFSLRHEFTRLDAARQFGIVIRFGGPSPIEPAVLYRAWMAKHQQLVTLAEKFKTMPRAERLAGALHAYIWGGYLRPEDIRDWKGLCKLLAREGPRDAAGPAGRIWKLFGKEARSAVREGTGENGPYDYLREVITREFEQVVQSPSLPEGSAPGLLLHERCARNARWLATNFPDHFTPPETWGDGISLKFLKALLAIGVDRAVLILNDLHPGDRRPEVAIEADRMGYLYGPYDCYDSVHKPGEKDSWETAQFDQALYETGGVIRKDGTLKKGFEGRGRFLNAQAARPYVEQRVKAIMAITPDSAWFMDGDAFGEWLDDYSPKHPSSQAQNLAARLDRMRWIATTYGIPVGSEGGSALASGVICFAHGMLTPAIGWDDKDLHNEKSKYWLGTYWPPEAPTVFFKQVPLKPKYFRKIYDPRYRLPLYEAALHDSVVATHQWGNGSLKFKDIQTTVALTEQLYNVPPLYHLTLAELDRDKGRIAAGYRFFSPLHRRLAYQPLTGFRWLTDDHLVQETTFGDGTVITANFRDHAAHLKGLDLPAETVTARREGETLTYRPGRDTVTVFVP